jgi:HEAT repeat protein/cyclophilin family peptidyl-prolyl cis-trans isomerase
LQVELVKRHETKMLVVWTFLLAVAAGWLLLTRPAYRIEGDFLFHEDERNTSDGWIAEQMRSPVAETRARACLAFGRIGDPASLQSLLEALRDPIPRVRAAAAFAIGLIEDRQSLAGQGRAPDPRAPQALLAALDDDERPVVTRAVEALGKAGWQAAFPRITGTAAPVPVTMTALVRLGRREAIPWITLHLRSDDQDTRRSALFALNELEAPLDAAITRSLLNFTKDINLWVRIAAVRALGRCQFTSEVVDTLAAMTHDTDPKVRIEALRSLAGLRRGDSVPVFVASLDDANENVRRAAVEALGVFGNRAAIPVLRRLRFQPSPVAYEAERSLAILATSDDEFFSGLDDFPTAYRSPEGLAGFAGALRRVGSPEAVKWLRRLWNLEGEDIRLAKPALLRVFAEQPIPELDAFFEQSIRSPDSHLRLAALELLPAPGLDLCRRAYVETLETTGGEAQRVAALEAAARAPDTADRKALFVRALEDPHHRVRVVAVKHLRLLYGENQADKIGLADAAYARHEYQRIARTIGWRVVMETSAGVLEITLDYENAALTAESFLQLARQGAFDGMRFGEVATGHFIRADAPSATSQQGAAFQPPPEINPQPFLRGSLGMAEPGPYTPRAFFICLSPQPLWDSRLTNFGRLVSGDNVLDRITADTRILRVTAR